MINKKLVFFLIVGSFLVVEYGEAGIKMFFPEKTKCATESFGNAAKDIFERKEFDSLRDHFAICDTNDLHTFNSTALYYHVFLKFRSFSDQTIVSDVQPDVAQFIEGVSILVERGYMEEDFYLFPTILTDILEKETIRTVGEDDTKVYDQRWVISDAILCFKHIAPLYEAPDQEVDIVLNEKELISNFKKCRNEIKNKLGQK